MKTLILIFLFMLVASYTYISISEKQKQRLIRERRFQTSELINKKEFQRALQQLRHTRKASRPLPRTTQKPEKITPYSEDYEDEYNEYHHYDEYDYQEDPPYEMDELILQTPTQPIPIEDFEIQEAPSRTQTMPYNYDYESTYDYEAYEDEAPDEYTYDGYYYMEEPQMDPDKLESAELEPADEDIIQDYLLEPPPLDYYIDDYY